MISLKNQYQIQSIPIFSYTLLSILRDLINQVDRIQYIQMQQVSPKVLKQRQEKYEKLLKMIKGFQRTHEQLKLLEKIKSDTVFEISLRFRRCEANKNYKFPKTTEVDQSYCSEEDNLELVNNKDLIYNLHSQNKLKTDPGLDRHRIRVLQTEKTISKRQKSEATSSPMTRVHSLRSDKTRYSRQRIDRIEKLHVKVEQQRLRTERASEKKLSQERSITKIPCAAYKPIQHRKGIVLLQTLSNNQSNHLTPIKITTIPNNKQICKGKKSQLSAIKLDRSRPKIKLATESTETSVYRTSQKKLNTEQSEIQTAKKCRIHNFLSNQIKKAEKINILAGASNLQKLKQKNLFQKKIY